MQNEYLDKVASLLKNKRAKAQILPELESHIAEKIDYYREIGYDEEEAQKRALEEMGDPEETALSLNSLHNEKWYKIPFNIISVLVLAAIAAILLICPQRFAYCDDYVHDVIYDFLSLGIFSTYVVLLILARRFRSKFVPIAIAVFLILQIVTPVVITKIVTDFDIFDPIQQIHVTDVFQPFLYGIFTLVTKGPLEYIDSLFGYAYISDSYSTAFTVGTVLIYALLIIWSVFCFINVARGERMKSTKNLNRTLKIGGRITAVFTAMCIVVTSVSTALAYSVIDYKISENQLVREQMINCALNIDLFGKSPDEITEEMKKIKMGNLPNDEYRLEHSYLYGKDTDYSALFGYCKDNNFIELNYDGGRSNFFAITYSTTTIGINSPLNKYLYVKPEDFEGFRDNRSLYPTTLDEFLESGLQNYAAWLHVSEGLKWFWFMIDPESDGYIEERSNIISIAFDENNLMKTNTAFLYEEEDHKRAGASIIIF